MRVTFWGVRGSIPVPGPHTVRYGGNSSCVLVEADGLPPLVIDAGTGIRGLGHALVASPGRALHLLFSHLHVDHVYGLPFFAPLWTPGFRVGIHVPAASDGHARERLQTYLGGVLHPARVGDFGPDVSISAVRAGRVVDAGGWKALPVALNHPGGSLAYRVEVGGRVFCHVTDTAPFARPHEGLLVGESPTRTEQRVVDALRGADLVSYDTMFTREAYLERMTWGHSYPEYAVALCAASGVRTLLLFHHLPDATDDELDALGVAWSHHRAPSVLVVREGASYAVGEAAMYAEG
jgi:phosphoribosyl 1,2-cyclic phosphodiesterase